MSSRGGGSTSRVRELAMLTALGLLTAACGGPSVAVDAHPRDASLHIDGRPVPVPVEGPAPYHGVMELTATPAPPAPPTPADAGSPRLAAVRKKLAAPEPVTPWIFPLDFFVELAMAPFVDDPVYRATISLPPREDVPVTGYRATGIEAFVRRARAAASDR